MSEEERPFDPMNEPEQCPSCNSHPDWLEVVEDVFQCQNCWATINVKGKIIEEPSQDDD